MNVTFVEKDGSAVGQSEGAPNAAGSQTVQFENASGSSVVLGGQMRSSHTVADTPASLKEFLGRPVRVRQGSWDTGTGNMFSINPWHEFLSEPTVINKLAYYKYIRGTLHARISVTANPFQYGLAALFYWPFQNKISHCTTISLNRAIQLPHCFINPSGDNTVEQVIPFISPRNFIDLSRTDYTSSNYSLLSGMDLGRLHFHEFVPLTSASVPGAQSIQYTLYMWMTDVEVCMPTPYEVVVQSGDEYGKGAISAPASTVARVAGYLTSVPIIGPFALATQIAAGAVAGIAKIFGFSRPTLLTDLAFYKGRTFSPLATTVGGDASMKLTLDPKQEVTVDPAVVGFSNVDEMSLASILAREGLVANVGWATTDTIDTELAIIPVTPMLCDRQYDAGMYNMRRTDATPLAYVGHSFSQWTGSLRYRIQIISSSFHKGQLQICYYPTVKDPMPTLDPTNVTYNKIVDISKDTSIEFEIPWAQTLPWLPNFVPASYNPTSPVALITDFGRHNGFVVIKVQNSLSVTEATADVRVIVTVAAGKDFKYSMPSVESLQKFFFDGTNERSAWPLDTWNYSLHTDAITQAGDVLQPSQGPSAQPLFPSLQNSEDAVAICVGEEVVSLRQLVKRSTVRLVAALKPQTSELIAARFNCLVYDYNSNRAGFYSVDTDDKYSCRQSFLSYFGPLFTAQRGGIRIKVLAHVQDASGAIIDNKRNIDWTLGVLRTTAHTIATQTGTMLGELGTYVCEVVCAADQKGLEFEVPSYSMVKFNFPGFWSNSTTTAVGWPDFYDTVVQLVGSRTGGTAQTTVHYMELVSAAEDFSWAGFTCTPIQYDSARARTLSNPLT